MISHKGQFYIVQTQNKYSELCAYDCLCSKCDTIMHITIIHNIELVMPNIKAPEASKQIPIENTLRTLSTQVEGLVLPLQYVRVQKFLMLNCIETIAIYELIKELLWILKLIKVLTC